MMDEQYTQFVSIDHSRGNNTGLLEKTMTHIVYLLIEIACNGKRVLYFIYSVHLLVVTESLVFDHVKQYNYIRSSKESKKEKRNSLGDYFYFLYYTAWRGIILL